IPDIPIIPILPGRVITAIGITMLIIALLSKETTELISTGDALITNVTSAKIIGTETMDAEEAIMATGAIMVGMIMTVADMTMIAANMTTIVATTDSKKI